MSKAANRILAKMRRTSSGWKASDMMTLYTGFGFRVIEGSKHTRYLHAGTGQSLTVTRASGEISKAYAEDAVKAIDRVLQVEAMQADNE